MYDEMCMMKFKCNVMIIIWDYMISNLNVYDKI